LAVKTQTIKGTYAGDATFKTSSGTVQQTVQVYTTTTALSASPNPSNYGEAVVLTAVVTTSGSSMPTGKVTFQNRTTTLGTGTLNATGIATPEHNQVASWFGFTHRLFQRRFSQWQEHIVCISADRQSGAAYNDAKFLAESLNDRQICEDHGNADQQRQSAHRPTGEFQL
jgi:hypothetical protein